MTQSNNPHNLDFHKFNQLPWEQLLIIAGKKVTENMRMISYRDKAKISSLAFDIKKVGTAVKDKEGVMYQVIWDKRFKIWAYPKNGICQFNPMVKQAGLIDIMNSFLVFLCGQEPLLPQYVPPSTLPRLNYTREQALDILNAFKINFLGIERPILSDPYNALPNKAEVTQEHPALRHLPKGRVRQVINKSGKLKEIETSGTPLDAELTDALNFEKPRDGSQDYKVGGNGLSPHLTNTNEINAYTIDSIRHIADHCLEAEDREDRHHQENRDHFAQVQLTIEDSTHATQQLAHGHAILNKDLEALLQRIPPNLPQILDEIQTKPAADFTETNALLRENNDLQREHIEVSREHESNSELRATEQANQLAMHDERLVHHHRDMVVRDNATNIHIDHIKQVILQNVQDLKQKVESYHKGVIFQTGFFMRRWQELRILFETMHLEIPTLIYRIRDDMREIYAKILAILEQVPSLTAAQLASIFNVKPNKMHYWLKVLREKMHFICRKKQQKNGSDDQVPPKSELQNSQAQPSEIKHNSTKQTRMRKEFHYFLRKFRFPREDIKNKHRRDSNGC